MEVLEISQQGLDEYQKLANDCNLEPDNAQDLGSKTESEEKEPIPMNQGNQSKNLDDYLRIGDDYFEIIYRPNKDGDFIKTLTKRQIKTITDDFCELKRIDIVKRIKKYTGYCCVPSHLSYQSEINGFYNRYTELKHTPVQGDCQTTINFIKHIFGSQYEMGLDYLQLLYENPTQKLPILCLVSYENNTGKSTFGDLLKMIFGDNTTKVSNSDLASNFNAPYAQKLVIILDETSIEKNAITQAVKRMSTEQGTIIINEKNVNQYEVDFFGKFVFISNDETKFMHIEEKDTRFWIIKVPTISEINPNTPRKISSEIPAFLDYLSKRKLHHKCISRVYFDEKLFETEAKQRAKEANIHPVKREIIELVKDTFEAYPHLIELQMGVKDILDETEQNRSKYINRQSVKDNLTKLKEDRLCEWQSSRRYKFHSLRLSEISDTYTPEPKDRNNSHYLFKIQNYLGVQEFERRISTPLNSSKMGMNTVQSTNNQQINNNNGYPIEWDK